jgi:hypothetical protein
MKEWQPETGNNPRRFPLSSVSRLTNAEPRQDICPSMVILANRQRADSTSSGGIVDTFHYSNYTPRRRV